MTAHGSLGQNAKVGVNPPLYFNVPVKTFSVRLVAIPLLVEITSTSAYHPRTL
jgi:hypothetical protein